MSDLALGFIYYLVFVLSTTLHEAAHALAAKLGGDLTAYHGGQVSLDPRPHIRREPFGMVVLPLLSVLVSGWPFGFASAPYDPHWALRYPKRAAWMALAGPGANLLLVITAFILIRVGLLAGIFVSPDSAGFSRVVESAQFDDGWRGAALVLSVFFSMNLMLFLLNLIPLPPLDGSAGMALILSERTAERYLDWLHGNQALGMIGMLAAWRIFDVIYDPLFVVALNLLYPGASYG